MRYLSFSRKPFVFRKMSSTEKKPRLVSVNPIFSDTELIQRFQDAYTNQLPIHEKGLYTKIKFDFLFKMFSSSCKIGT